MKNSKRSTKKSCPVCKQEGTLENALPEANIYRCRSCDHAFTDLNSLDGMEDYSEDYFDEEHKNWMENPNIDLFDRIAEQIRRRRKRSVLDLGCGNGALLKHLSKHYPGLELTGIDLAPNEDTTGKIRYLQGDLLSYAFEQKFDVVVGLAVIEHVLDIDGFMERIHGLLKEDGLAFIMTLNDRSLLYTTARVLNKVGFRTPYERLYSKHHLNHFNKSSLRKLVELHRFRVDEHICHNIPLKAIDVPQSLVFKRLMKTGVVGLFLAGRLTGKTYLQTVVVSR